MLMEQTIVMVFVIIAGVLTWRAMHNVLLTILAVIIAGFIGTFISFLIHQSRRKRQMGFSSIRELNEYDRIMKEMRIAVAPEIEKQLAEAEEQARREGYPSLDAKHVAEMRERIKASKEASD